MPRGTLFLNPSSGAKLSAQEKERLRSSAEAEGLEVIEIGPGVHITKSVRERIERGINLFVAAGGDGTITHVVQGLVQTEAVLGVIPIGTYNHFARDLEIPLEWPEALEVVMRGSTRQVDVARVNERYFVNNLSIGLYPDHVARREQKGRDYPRWKARLIAAWGTLQSFQDVTLMLESDESHEVVRTQVFMVSNNPYDLNRVGIEASRESLEGGRLTAYWLPKLPRYQMMKFVGHYLAGRVHEAPGFRSFRTQRLKVQSPQAILSAGIDGELAALATPMTLTIVPQSLNVKVPRQDE